MRGPYPKGHGPYTRPLSEGARASFEAPVRRGTGLIRGPCPKGHGPHSRPIQRGTGLIRGPYPPLYRSATPRNRRGM